MPEPVEENLFQRRCKSEKLIYKSTEPIFIGVVIQRKTKNDIRIKHQ